MKYYEWLKTMKVSLYDNHCYFGDFKEGQVFIGLKEQVDEQYQYIEECYENIEDLFDDNDVRIGFKAGVNSQQEIIDDLKTVIKILEGVDENGWTPELSEVLSKVLKEEE